MHLSFLSDCFVSDSIQDAGRRVGHGMGSRDLGHRDFRSHRDGVLRGLALVAVAAFLTGLTCLANFAQPAAANTAPHLVAPSSGAAVNLMHREVIGH